ncbi:tetratricopeptide repeat protein [Chondromyces crocatus]|uniref:Uncharacterized protein n=1 Tax=Chondromyces crocatus TaxID=52 RepID=A0A0K1EE66_CHOCO|nr:hypothetical protein [Chondromyces crocatus]AKT39139.1 uncharacterized protein CMC5_032860 [Chondromyces crocatus]
MHRSAPLATAAAALLATFASSAWAQPQPPPPDAERPAAPTPDAPAVDTPEQIREKARTALASNDVGGACLLFEQAYEGAVRASRAGNPGPAPNDVLFELAACHERQGRPNVAVAEYAQVASAGGPNAEAARLRVEALQPPPQPPASMGPPSVPAVTPAPASPPVPSIAPVVDGPKEEPGVLFGDFMDTRLTWTFGDDDILHETGQALPISPNASVGDRRQYRLFFDNLNSRFAGRENLTHLVLYKKMPGFIRNLDTEASVVLRFDMASLSRNANNVNQALYDSGSFLRIFYHTDGKADGKQGIGLTFFPLDTDRMRLGYLYDISWGGTAGSINQSIFPRIVGSSPGAKIQFDHERFSVYAGFKTANIIEVTEVLTPGTSEVEELRVGETNYGVLGGVGVDINDYMHVDAGGGYFQQGKFDLPDVRGEPVYTAGLSARAVVHHPDMPTPQSIDFQLYRNDPNKPQVFFRPETYTEGKTTWAVSLEYTNLFQHLSDFEVAGATNIQQARAAALQANLKTGYLRASFTGIYRDLPYVLRNQPSLIPFQTIPSSESVKTSDELFFSVAADYYIPSARLTPGIGAGLQLPATFESNTVDRASSPISRTIVVREQGNISILPVNTGAVPIIQARASLKWDLSRIMSAVIWAQYVRDNNATFVERDPNEGTTSLRTFISPDFLGFGAMVQARF